ncbi:MAG TPA: sulfatase-like hydrolase/transferase [Candidatus Hydrogenedentes bacterium]|nr:sulfatase-like hydrolase/transferase [Candidatus Hydrogenedentota bacterium]
MSVVEKPKNILLIIADQFRHDAFGAAGHPVVHTPNLDALARDGAVFTNCFAQSAPCGPSRMCLYTGRYMCSTRSVNNMTPLERAEDNIAVYFRERGHHAAISGYNDYALDPALCAPDDPRRTRLDYDNFLPGFEVVLDHEHDSREYFDYLRAKGYPEAWCNHYAIHEPNVPPEGTGGHLPCVFPAKYLAEDSECRFHTSRVADYLDARPPAPWFLSVNYIKPHGPLVCAAPYHAMYASAPMPPPTRRPQELVDPHPYMRMARRTPSLMDERELHEYQAAYFGMITELDVCLGQLFDSLKKNGYWDNTLIVFTSDHGDYLGDHYLLDKGHFHDGTMRIPCIVRDPSPKADATRGTRIGAFVESIDIAPTLFDYAGLPMPDRFQGRSFLGHVHHAPDTPARTEIHYEFDFRTLARDLPDFDPDECLLWVLRDEAFKYVQFGRADFPPLLFDLQHDPGEFDNLADNPRYAATVAYYAQRMLRWRMKNEDQRMERWAYPHR